HHDIAIVISSSPSTLCFYLLIRPPLCSTLFPYTTLFRSVVVQHLLEVRNLPALVHRVTEKTAAELIVEAALRHGRERRDRHVKRSEEHTSELQSQSNLVCRLLLEKKKTQIK